MNETTEKTGKRRTHTQQPCRYEHTSTQKKKKKEIEKVITVVCLVSFFVVNKLGSVMNEENKMMSEQRARARTHSR